MYLLVMCQLRVRETKALGVCIDEFLSWDKHVDKIAKKV